MKWKQALKKIPQGLMNMNLTTGFEGKVSIITTRLHAHFGSNKAGAIKYTYSAFPFCVLAAISLSTNLLLPWNNRLNGNK
jgi:hypothetical protein